MSGGIAEIIKSGICPGIITGTSRAAETKRLPRYDRQSDTYYDRARRRRVAVGGAARVRDIKAHGEVDLQDFKTAEEFMAYNDGRAPKPKPIPADEAAATVVQAERDIKAGRVNLRAASEATQEFKRATDPMSQIKAIRKAKAALGAK